MANKLLPIIFFLFLGGLAVFGWLLVKQEGDDTPSLKPAEIISKSRSTKSDIPDTVHDDPAKVILEPERPNVKDSKDSEDHKSLAPDEGLIEILVLREDTKIPIEKACLSIIPNTDDDVDRIRFFESVERQGWFSGGLMDILDDFFPSMTGGKKYFTDDNGRASIHLPIGIPFRLAAAGKAFQVDASNECALHPGEQRKVELDLQPVVFYGRVVDNRPDGHPIMGAEIVSGWYEGYSITTDEAGLFFLERDPAGPEYATIRAEGYGPAVVGLTKGHESELKAQVIRLNRQAALFGRIIGSKGPEPGSEITITADMDEIAQGDDWFSARVIPWISTTDEAGFYRFDGLPACVELNVSIVLSGRKPVSMTEPLVLKPGEARRADWTLASFTTIYGRVVDQYDRPVSGILVIAKLSDISEDKFKTLSDNNTPVLMRGDYEKRMKAGLTDTDGNFVFLDLPPGIYEVGVQIGSVGHSHLVEGNQYFKVTKEYAGVSSSGIIVNVMEGVPEVRVIVKVYRGIYIRGLVVGPSGDPVNDALVGAYAVDAEGYIDTETDEIGAFSLGPLNPGKYKLQAQGFISQTCHADSNEVIAEAGDENVLLTMRTGGVLRGRILGCKDFRMLRGTVYIHHQETGRLLETSVNSDGSFLFGGLEQGTYDLYVEVGKDRFGSVFGIDVTTENKPEEVLVNLETAAILVLKTDTKEGFFYCVVHYKEFCAGVIDLSPYQPCTIKVPPGHLMLALYRKTEKGRKDVGVKEVDVQSGDRMEVLFDIDN